MNTFLRPAEPDDAKIILEWRNDELTRANSFSKEEIDPETHLNWFNRKLSDENCFLYILMDEEERVGQIRVDRTADVGSISYMIAPNKRGMGYGNQIIALIEKEVKGKVRVLVGQVEHFNIASAKCFAANGYVELVGREINCYVKTL